MSRAAIALTNWMVDCPTLPGFIWRLIAFMAVLVVWVVGITYVAYTLWFPDLLQGLGPSFAPLTIGLTLVAGTPMAAILLALVSRVQNANERLRLLSRTDGLTGLPNRRAFVADVQNVLHPGAPEGALLLLDIDHFKKVNDTYGHPIGDAALKKIAETLRRFTREGDVLGRLGGEEFGIYLHSAEPSAAEHIAERIRQSVRANIRLQDDGGRSVPLSVSVGGAMAPIEPVFDAIYRLADFALYRAKATGRNRVVLLRGADMALTPDGAALPG